MRPPETTRVPEILSALDTALTAALTDWQVIYGPLTSENLERDYLMIAPGNEQEPGAVTKYEKQKGYGTAYIEVVEVILNIMTTRGETDMSARIAKAKEGVAAVQQALTTDPTLGGACEETKLGAQMFWHPVQHSNGATVGVGLTVIARTNI